MHLINMIKALSVQSFVERCLSKPVTETAYFQTLNITSLFIM